MSVTKFSNQKILVIGDIMLDRYIMGNITRISPEAPVPIVHVQEEKAYPGGAANVAHNIVTMGGMALLIGVCGADPAGKQLEHALDTAGIQAALIHDGSTVQKVRVVSHQHHIVRLDYEDKRTLSDDAQARLLSAIEQHLPDCSGIIISDYAKGCITTQVMDALRQHAAGKPIIIDPKPANKALYAGATLITPNAAEAASMSGCADISDAGRELVASLGSSVIITRGPEGMSIFEKGKRSKQVDIPTQAKAIYDVSGAGDAVVAALALCVASAMDLRESAIVANHAGGIKVGKPGTAPVYQQELVAVMEKENNKVKTLEAVAKITERLRQEGRRVVTTNGCFDIIHPGHIHLLSQARAMGDVLVLLLNSDDSVRQLKGLDRPILTERERAEVLSALTSVDYIVFFNEQDPRKPLASIKPHIHVKGGNFAVGDIVEREIVERNGGEIRLLPQDEELDTESLIRRVVKNHGG